MNNFFESKLNSTNHLDRVEIAKNAMCPADILRAFCYDEINPEVVQAAIENVNCNKTWVDYAKNRLLMLKEEEIVHAPLPTLTNEITEILSNTNHLIRESLASRLDCPERVLKMFCEEEQVKEVVHRAACHPLTKAELLNRIADGLPVDPNFAKKFRIKRAGKDKNDIFW